VIQVRPGSTPTVTSKALALLAAFTMTHRELTLSAMAERAGLTLSTAQRRAAELTAWGALEKTPSGTYRIGLRLYEIGALAERTVSLRTIAEPYLQDLHIATREYALLAVRDGTDVVFIDQIRGRSRMKMPDEIGLRLPMHASTAGQVLLSHAPTPLVEEILASPLESVTATTVTDPALLRSRLADVRKKGYAVNGGGEEHWLSVAAPVTDGAGHVIASVNVVAPHRDTKSAPLVGAVRMVASGISRACAESGHIELH
jgi:DNA-binding IclR family transcriptional regulator